MYSKPGHSGRNLPALVLVPCPLLVAGALLAGLLLLPGAASGQVIEGADIVGDWRYLRLYEPESGREMDLAQGTILTFRPDGTAESVTDSGTQQGRWRLDGDRLILDDEAFLVEEINTREGTLRLRHPGESIFAGWVAILARDARHPVSARQQLCQLAISLGQASAREQLFGKVLGETLPADQVSAIATHMSDAAAALEAAEAGFQPPFSQQRPTDSIRHLLTSMEGYMEWREGRSWEHRHREIDNLFGQYRRTLEVTFVSSRPDATRYQPNCDSNTLKACFHLGRASVAAAIPASDRRAARANAVQSDANGNMATAIREGQDLAIDNPPDPNVRKVCCSFGAPEAWAAVPTLQPTSPVSTYLAARKVVEAAVGSTSTLACGVPRVSGSGVAIPEDIVRPTDVVEPTDVVTPGGEGDEEAARTYELGFALWDEDPGQAYRLLVEAAEAGEARAQLQTGYALESGHGVQQDLAAAAGWYRKAAEQGNAQAQRNLAYFYQRGQGVPKDCSRAVTWYQRAAAQGFAEAQNDMGYLHHTATCVERDYAVAADWYEKAADQDHAWALTNLAVLYEHGNGRPKDEARAIELYSRAARLGNEKAQQELQERGLDW